MISPEDRDFCDLFPDIHSVMKDWVLQRVGDPPPEINLGHSLLKSSVLLKGLHLIAPDDHTWSLTFQEKIAIYQFDAPKARGVLRTLLAQVAFGVRELFASDYYQDVNDYLAQKALPKSQDDEDSAQREATKERSTEGMKPNPYGFDIVIGGKVRVHTNNQRGDYWLRIDDIPGR